MEGPPFAHPELWEHLEDPRGLDKIKEKTFQLENNQDSIFSIIPMEELPPGLEKKIQKTVCGRTYRFEGRGRLAKKSI